jgi:MFS family permease
MTVLLSLGGLVCTMSTSMIAPALDQISLDLDMKPSVMQLTLSIYLLAFVFGSPLIASVSEMYGRKPAYIMAHMWYIIWNTLCPVSNSKGFVIACRFLSGFGGSVSIAVSLYCLSSPVQKLTGHLAACWPFCSRHLESRKTRRIFELGSIGSATWSCDWAYSWGFSFTEYRVALDILDCVLIRWYASCSIHRLRTGIVHPSPS